MRNLLILAILSLMSCPLSSNANHEQHLVPFKVSSVYDGDTIRGVAKLWPSIMATTSVRVRGIDTPEIRGGCDESKRLGQSAKALTDSLIREASHVTLRSPKPDKYGGRVVADVLLDGKNLSHVLLDRGLAKPYTGKTKKPNWCE